MTVAAGLLALGHRAALRSVDDGVPPEAAVAIAETLAAEFARAAEGQAQSLMWLRQPVEPLTAYQLTVGKSGPFGAMAAGIGAHIAGVQEDQLRLFQQFGTQLAVYSQLVNDAHDAGPVQDGGGLPEKRDVRDGQATVPLAFAKSRGTPGQLAEHEVRAWEHHERQRIHAAGGIALALGMAEAERLRALEVLEALRPHNFAINVLRSLLP
jgi:geranylgeranyl pyrophosphate synthase